MKHERRVRGLAFLAAGLLTAAAAFGQFRDDFRGPALPLDPRGENGWAFFCGDGAAVMDFQQAEGYASIFVDATKDTRNVWWALIKRRVSGSLDLARLAEPGFELRISARVRASHAPRRVNLHLNTQKTTDFHSHLMEFDLAEAGVWYPISMTTRDFEASPGDTVNGQLALMDWGLGKYRVDVDDFQVEVVEAAAAGPDAGGPVPYHPPVADPRTFAWAIPAAQSATIDAAFPDLNYTGWSSGVGEGKEGPRLLALGGTMIVLFRWNLGNLAGKKAAGSGLLELTTSALEALVPKPKDFGEARVVEILAGPPAWDRDTVTWNGFFGGDDPAEILNPQMIIDGEVNPARGGKTYFTISRPALQRLLDGRALGLAVRPLGAIHAAFPVFDESGAACSARLLVNLEK